MILNFHSLPNKMFSSIEFECNSYDFVSELYPESCNLTGYDTRCLFRNIQIMSTVSNMWCDSSES